MEFFWGKSSINGPFSMAMLNNQMVKAMDFWLVETHGHRDFHSDTGTVTETSGKG
jgi:hypothetical protein